MSFHDSSSWLLSLLPGVLLAFSTAVHAVQPLTLVEAERLALDRDPAVARYGDEALGREQAADAAGGLPNPMIIGQVMNMPFDGRVDESAMAQFRLGVRQTFPRGESRRLAREREQALAVGDRARAKDAARKTRRAVRQLYLELAYQRRVIEVLADNRILLEDILQVTEREFAVGTAMRQNVLEAELELERLEDRISAVQERDAQTRAEFARWVGADAAERPLVGGLPSLPNPEGEIIDHPLLAVDEAGVAGAQHRIDLARQGYRPQWSVEFSYGYAPGAMGSADSLSAMLTLDLPLFRRERVSSEVTAERHRRDAAHHNLIERERMFRGQMDAARGRWQQLITREQRFEGRLIERAEQFTEAAEQAYRSGTADFTDMMRARVMVLQTRLDALRVATDRRAVQADLLYLLGETEQ